MSYKPKHCCQCGEKIERIDWKPWTSRRFCQFCATEYGIYDWIPRLIGSGLVLMLFIINVYFQKSEKPVNISPNQLLSSVPNGRTPTGANAVQNTPTNANAAPLKSPATATKAADAKTSPVENAPIEAAEKVYLCGAATKKGTPCSRRVKGGGRCWQHVGQTAMAAPGKSFAGR